MQGHLPNFRIKELELVTEHFIERADDSRVEQMYLNPKYMKIKYGKYEKMRFGAAHTHRRNVVKPIIAAMRESVKYIYIVFLLLHFFLL